MKKSMADAIMKAAKDLGLLEAYEDDKPEVSMRENYSGRNMFGQQTSAIVCSDFGQFTQLVAKTAENLTREEFKEYDENAPETEIGIEEFIDSMNFRWDNMGKNSIVVY